MTKKELWRQLVFFVGDIRLLRSFPYVTWSVPKHRVSYGEILEGLPQITYGDVGVHRDWGYLTNIAIPGFMKHAWIHVRDGLAAPQIVEAMSEGVIARSAIYPMVSDYTVIFRPRNVTEAERKGACKKARQIVGKGYDVDFAFDIEYELQYFAGEDTADASAALQQGQRFMRRYDPAFTCTEVVSYAWWHRREELRLIRREVRGQTIILADDFFNDGWEIKWMSRSVTPETARRHGLHEQGCEMIADYRRRC
ncbi:MAG: hypothetical protein ABIL58_07230 [Pseudomonadota bacterium]